LIPGALFYVLAALLVGFGGWRILLARNPEEKRPRYHLVWGIVYIIAGVWLLLTQLGVLHAPRFGG
jgi:hypothetical protein